LPHDESGKSDLPVKQAVGDDAARHISLLKHDFKFKDLKVGNLISLLSSAEERNEQVISQSVDATLKAILNYGAHDKSAAEAKSPVKGHSWRSLSKSFSIHVTEILSMVEDLAPFGLPAKHAYMLIRFSDGHIDRCDLMPKKGTGHLEIRGFLPGIDVPGKVRYNPWINDQRAKSSHVMDIYMLRKGQPSLLSVELLKQHLQEHEYKEFNLESHNCQDFVHDVVAKLAKVKEEDNVRFNSGLLDCLRAWGLRCDAQDQNKCLCFHLRLRNAAKN